MTVTDRLTVMISHIETDPASLATHVLVDCTVAWLMH